METLFDSEDIIFIELDHIGQFSFFFSEFSILFLLFAQLRGSFKKSLEVFFVAFVFEEIDLCEELFLLLLQLSDLFLQLSRIHAFGAHLLNILMSCLELSLEVFVDLEGLPHIIIDKELIWDLKRNQEFGSISSSLELWHFSD
jgi:hypothetical protein